MPSSWEMIDMREEAAGLRQQDASHGWLFFLTQIQRLSGDNGRR